MPSPQALTMVSLQVELGPAVLQAPRAVAPPAGTGDAVVLYYSQTRSRQEAGLFGLKKAGDTGDKGGNHGEKH